VMRLRRLSNPPRIPSFASANPFFASLPALHSKIFLSLCAKLSRISQQASLSPSSAPAHLVFRLPLIQSNSNLSL
jgi:hypothetical protein